MSLTREPRLVVHCDHRSTDQPEGCAAHLVVITADPTPTVAAAAARDRGWWATEASQFCPKHHP